MRTTILLALALALLSPAAAQEAAPAAPAAMQLEPVPYPLPAALGPAAKAQLQAERQAFAQDLRGIYQWRSTVAHKIRPLIGEMAEEDAEKIIQELQAGALDTPQDNLERFYRALAARVPVFAHAFELSKAGKWADAAGEVEPLMKENPYTVGIKKRLRHDTLPPFCYSTIKLFYAECLGRAGNLSDCTIAYHVVYMVVPHSLTLCAPAMLRVAEVYAQTQRTHYAIPVYQALALRHGALLSDAENLRLVLRAMKLSLESDPYRLGERTSGEVLGRLERGETGPSAQAAGAALLAHLRGMLVGVDEEARPFLESTMAIVQGASTGKLQSGKIAGELILADRPEENGDDQWGKLPPRERQQLLETFREKYPERYSEMLEQYYRRLSEIESQQGH